MVKKVLNYAAIPVLAVLFVFCMHHVTFQVHAAPAPTQIPTSIPTDFPTDFPTIPPIDADISNEFTDENFKKAVWQWLGKSGTPGAFSRQAIKNRIDAGFGSFAALNKNISSLKGLEYFEGLSSINCNGNNLTSITHLPSTLKTLFCSNNKLSSLPSLPASMRFLDCSNNNLTNLPEIPANMERLYCSNNKLTNLPTLPNRLIELYVDGNQLTAINIPGQLEKLYCGHNKLKSLPELPFRLKVLSCEYNQLKELPAIPSSIREINVYENYLSELPDLPDWVERFRGEYNYLDVFSTSAYQDRPDYIFEPQYRIKYTGPEILEIEIGETVTLNIKKQESSDSRVWNDVADIPTGNLTFTSDNNSVAKVNSAGVITGESIGTTHINVFFKGIDSKFTKTVIYVKVIPTASALEPTEPPEETHESPQYGETSSYAIPFMEQASELGIITDRLKGKSMVVPTTREEFAELAVRFYEKVTGNTAPIPVGKTFTDCSNPEVLKAYGLKITYGTGDGTKFEPNAKLSRQQMAAMIERTLKACYPNIVIDTLGQPDFKDQKDFADYAIVPAKFMAKYTITVGDGQGSFNPNGDCLRQQTFIFLVKAYNFRDMYIYE
ncbi:MAG: S-layer homology domain-containing protein [Acetivibrionales bacterium]|jgi:hypothetical protein